MWNHISMANKMKLAVLSRSTPLSVGALDTQTQKISCPSPSLT